MSYEGFYQRICEKGHYWEIDAYSAEANSHCPVCQKKIVWENQVDQTNGSYDEDCNRIDGYVSLRPFKVKKCKECGTVLLELYKPPKGQGRKV